MDTNFTVLNIYHLHCLQAHSYLLLCSTYVKVGILFSETIQFCKIYIKMVQISGWQRRGSNREFRFNQKFTLFKKFEERTCPGYRCIDVNFIFSFLWRTIAGLGEHWRSCDNIIARGAVYRPRITSSMMLWSFYEFCSIVNVLP